TANQVDRESDRQVGEALPPHCPILPAYGAAEITDQVWNRAADVCGAAKKIEGIEICQYWRVNGADGVLDRHGGIEQQAAAGKRMSEDHRVGFDRQHQVGARRQILGRTQRRCEHRDQECGRDAHRYGCFGGKRFNRSRTASRNVASRFLKSVSGLSFACATPRHTTLPPPARSITSAPWFITLSDCVVCWNGGRPHATGPAGTGPACERCG